MIKDEAKLKEILVKSKYLSQEDAKVISEISERENISFQEYCISQGYLTEDLIGQAIAEDFGVSYSDLNSRVPGREQVNKIPEDIGKKYRVVLFLENNEHVVITTDNPKTVGLKEALSPLFPHKKLTVTYSLSKDIDSAFIHYREDLDLRLQKVLKSKQANAPQIIQEIFEDALAHKASDIHFEPRKEEIVVRLRIDGVMKIVAKIPKTSYETILNRIKVQGEMKIDEHSTTQDGAIRYESPTREVDMRVSIIPTINGEKIVIRLLAEYVKGFGLQNLGLSQDDADILERAIRKPFGMILVTGPTGSGKTTTLYALLKILNKTSVNITTIEDPPEYKIPGINQIKVNEQTGVTFAKGLRSIVRQDPDIILVGEIRDKETAEIAVNAALTGHLVLSTFHSNDAATAIPRLLDMGVEPFLLSSTLELIIGQRLVRKIKEECRKSHAVNTEELEAFRPGISKYFQDTKTLYDGSGCGENGYLGRTGIFEFIEVTTDLKDMVLKNPSTNEIWGLAREQGSKSLFEDGVDKVKRGVTSLEELLRVADMPHERKEDGTRK